MSIGSHIRFLREQRRLSQSELARKTGCLSQPQVSKIETGERRVTLADLTALARALDVSPAELVEQSQQTQPETCAASA